MLLASDNDCDPLPHWDDPDYLPRHLDYHTSFPEVSTGAGYENFLGASEEAILPVYYGNLCARIVPVIDILIGRLIENEESALLIDIIDRFHPIYNLYHSHPIEFVLSTFRYYDTSPALIPEVRRSLLRLCTSSFRNGVATFSPSILQYAGSSMSDRDDSDIFSMQFYQELLLRLADQITAVSLSSAVTESAPQFFYEFRSVFGETLSIAGVELICLPVSPKSVSESLLEAILAPGTPTNATPSGKLMHAYALVLSHLPERYLIAAVNSIVQAFLNQIMSLGSGPSAGPDLDLLSPFSGMILESDWKTLSSMLLDNRHSRLLSALYHLLEHIPSLFPKFIINLYESVSGRVHWPLQLLFLCRSFAPFISAQRNSEALISSCLLAARGLVDIARHQHIKIDDPADHMKGKAHVDVVIDYLVNALPEVIPHLESKGLANLRLLMLQLPRVWSERFSSLRDGFSTF
uniref:Uncharacterized protein n=1 Tax=Spongospora subterranea TaxID=70186 RepID=A0A0H5QW22_9EUKA|eukprot:CRZ06193.1 hypothetical protein [Spongospora subterranea]